MKATTFRNSASGNARWLLAALALGMVGVLPSSTVSAADGHLNEGTVFVLSTDDWGAMSAAMKNSDQGRFFADPETRRIMDTLKKGLIGLAQKSIQEQTANVPEGVDPAMVQKMANDAIALMTEYADTLCGSMSGRVSLSFGMFQDPTVPAPVNMILEFGGNDAIHALNGRFIDMIVAASEGEAKKTSFELGGFQMMGVEQQGMGVLIGRKGDRFIAGIHRAGITDYLTAVTENKVRLGNVAFYKSAMATVGTGSMRTFMHLEPVWGMALGMMAGMPTADGEPNPAEMMQALGLTDMQGMASAGNVTPAGMSQRTFIGMNSRKGLMRLIPTENKPLAPPPFAPASVLSANAFRIELSQILNIVRDVMVVLPEAERAQFEGQLAGMKDTLGFSVDELLSDLEGTFFYASPAGGAPPNPMAMMMGGGASLDMSFALKLNSKARFEQLLAMVADPELSQGMVTKQEVSGRPVWAATIPMGPAPMQVAVAFEKDWLIIGSGVETLKKAFARADSGQNLGSNAAFQALMGKVGGTAGMAVTYKDTGKVVSQTLDMVRPMIGMLPMFVPDIAQQPDLLFLFDPTLIPSSMTIQKYFGEKVSRTRIVDGGLMSEAWAPSKSAPKPEKKEESSSK